MPASWIEHRGQRVLLIDMSNLDDGEAIATLRQARAEARSQVAPSLLLVDLTGARLGTGFMRLVKMSEPLDSPLARRRAAIGVEGFNRVLLMGFNLVAGDKRVSSFASREQALDYLTSE